MNKTDAASVRAILESHEASGLHVDGRLWREVDQPGEMFLGTLATREEFLRFIWQSIAATRPLTPVGEPRTLFDCAIRLSAFGWEFQSLVQDGFEWFRRCVDIDAAFDYGKVGLVALTPLNEQEKRETPAGNYYIYDGVHKSIVLAKRLLRGETEYEPVQVFIADATTVVSADPLILTAYEVVTMETFLSFADVAQRMQSRDSSIQCGPYRNNYGLEGTSICFFHSCEWFEVNVHDAVALSPEEALKLLQASPETLLNNSDTDNYGAVRWYGGTWVGQHHVRVWYNPQAL